MQNDIRFQMYCDYLDELQKIKQLPLLPCTKKQKMYQEIIEDKSTKWIDIQGPSEDSNPVGFIIIGTYPNCHPAADFFIEESYIIPKYRRQRYMSSAVTKFVKKNKGIYCMFILKHNTEAKHFWFKLFEELGYLSCYLTDVGAGDKHCTQYGFMPGKDVH